MVSPEEKFAALTRIFQALGAWEKRFLIALLFLPPAIGAFAELYLYDFTKLETQRHVFLWLAALTLCWFDLVLIALVNEEKRKK